MRWDAFFGPGNELRLEPGAGALGSKVQQALEPFVRLVDERARIGMLPRLSAAGQPVRWYVGWREDEDQRFAWDVTRAFLGPSYADLAVAPGALQPVDDVERAFADEFQGRVLILAVPFHLRERARERMRLLARHLLEHPRRRAWRVRSVGRLLRDIEFALQQGQSANARTLIEELERGGDVDAANLAALRLRCLAGERRWNEVLGFPGLRGLFVLRLPRRAREAVLQAVYHGRLAVDGGCPPGIGTLPELWKHVLQEYAPLLGPGLAVTTPEAAFCLAVFPVACGEATGEPPGHLLEMLTRADWGQEADFVRSAWASARIAPAPLLVAPSTSALLTTPSAATGPQGLSGVTSGSADAGCETPEGGRGQAGDGPSTNRECLGVSDYCVGDFKPTVKIELCDGARSMQPATTLVASESGIEAIARPAAVATPPAPSWADAVGAALADGDAEHAFQIAQQAEPGRRRAVLLVQCAVLLRDIDAAWTALDAWEALPSADRQGALGQRRNAKNVGSLYELLGATNQEPTKLPQPVNSWLAWFHRLQATERWPGAVTAADNGIGVWSVEDVLGNSDGLDAVVGIIAGNLPPWASEALRNALPSLIDAFLPSWVDVRAIPLAEVFFDLLATDKFLSLPACDALVAVAAVRLAGTMPPVAWGEVAEQVATSVCALNSPSSLPVIVRALEMLLDVPDGNPLARVDAATRLLAQACRWPNKIDVALHISLKRLAGDLGVAAAYAHTPVAAPGGHDNAHRAIVKFLVDKYVALYSLTPRALQNAAKSLQSLCPQLRVETFEEHAATISMTEAARRCDLFVIATRSAKHAATTSIEAALDPARRAYARGGGAATMVQAVVDWATGALVSE